MFFLEPFLVACEEPREGLWAARPICQIHIKIMAILSLGPLVKKEKLPALLGLSLPCPFLILSISKV